MGNPIEEDGVNVSIKNHIASIEFHHPLSNSLPGKVLQELAKTITEMGNNDEITVIILKSAGERAFCAGASFDELISIIHWVVWLWLKGSLVVKHHPTEGGLSPLLTHLR